MATKKHWTEIRTYDAKDRVCVTDSYGTVCVSLLHEDGWPITFERFRMDDDGYMSRSQFDMASWYAYGLSAAVRVLA